MSHTISAPKRVAVAGRMGPKFAGARIVIECACKSGETYAVNEWFWFEAGRETTKNLLRACDCIEGVRKTFGSSHH